MIFNYISSAKVVFDVIDRYGIKSEDFVTRAPLWIQACLDDLKLRENTVVENHEIRFNNGRCLLPLFTKHVDWVVIDGHKCTYNESLYLNESGTDLNRGVGIVDGALSHYGEDIEHFDTNPTIDTAFAGSGSPYFYRVSNGWIHTNVSFGTMEIKLKKTDTVMDSIIGLEFPTIPDEFNVREAIAHFILKTMLIRGYIHPVLNLKENNEEINPSLAYKKFKALAKIYVARPNIDAREKWSYPMATLHGRRKPIYIDRNRAKLTNFGEPEESRQYHGLWAIAQDVFTNAVEFVYEENKSISITVPPTEGFHYLYISVPYNKTFSVFNQLSLDITNEFNVVGTDTQVGYYDNTVYRMYNKFYTGLGFEFSIEIE